ncbi:MAG: haloacid dehalogenase type II [Acidobacteria bacterium]|nr:haloacid dehalogenase type II [Acidobacteriota bacterium]
MNRRRFAGTLAGALGMAALRAQEAGAQEQRRTGQIKAVAFDGFVVFDPRSVEKRVEEQLPGRGVEFTNLWRTRQFEYCWLRTSGGKYADFWKVTDDALRYTAKSMKVSLTGAQHDALMEAYRTMPPWPDVREGMSELRRRGIRLAFLSNLTAGMLDANLKQAGLSEFFEPHLTTDRVQAYKPSPRAYQMGPDAFYLDKREIAFAAFGAWDAAGAKWFGYPTVWVNRGNVPAEELDTTADVVAKDFGGLVEFAG